MRVIVAGTRSFGLAALEAIQKDHDVAGVISPFEDKVGITADLAGIHWWHEGSGYPLETWVRLRQADIIVAAHSHAYIGRRTRAATRLGAIGYHPSLLPRHRGRDAVKWTIHMRDPVAGGTVYWFDDNVDGGPIAAQRWCHVDPKWDAHDLWRERLFPFGIALLTRTLDELDCGIIVAEPQNQRFATWEPSWERAPLFRPELPELGGPSGFEVRGRVER